MFALKRGQQIILNKPDAELQQKMRASYDLMKPIFDKVDRAAAVKESQTLNTGKMQEFVNTINRDCLELIP